MRILFLPYNLAFVQLHNAEELARRGHEVVFIILEKMKWKSDLVKIVHVPFFKFNQGVFRALWSAFLYHYYCLKYFIWTDAIQYIYEPPYPLQMDVRLAGFFSKRKIVEWVGSDIRIPEITMAESPWYQSIYNDGYEYAHVESKEKSLKTQALFAKNDFVPMVVPEMSLFVQKDLFPEVNVVNYRFDLSQLKPNHPKFDDKRRIRIIHAPSKLKAKGSHIIIPILEKLASEGHITFELIHNIDHSKVLEKMATCDLYIDQIILGSYAGAAMEAMSLGKPVMAFIMPSVYKAGISKDCPIINVNADNLEDAIRNFVKDPHALNQIGMASRKWMEKVHDVKKLTVNVEKIYLEN